MVDLEGVQQVLAMINPQRVLQDLDVAEDAATTLFESAMRTMPANSVGVTSSALANAARTYVRARAPRANATGTVLNLPSCARVAWGRQSHAGSCRLSAP